MLTAARPRVSAAPPLQVMVKPPVPCPNESGECCVEGCDNEESSLWYGKKGAKICKHCYDTKVGPKKRARTGCSPMAEMQQAPEQAGDTLVKIIKICIYMSLLRFSGQRLFWAPHAHWTH